MAILHAVTPLRHQCIAIWSVRLSKGGCGGSAGGGLVGGSRPDEVGLHTSLAFSFYSNNRLAVVVIRCNEG